MLLHGQGRVALHGWEGDFPRNTQAGTGGSCYLHNDMA